MSYGNYEFEGFSSKEGFNRSLGHFQTVSEILGDIEDYGNLADLLSDLLTDKEIEQIQCAPTVQALLVDKYGYMYDSMNMTETLSDFSALCDEVKKWNALDIVISYMHPELGYSLINPKNPDHWAQVRELKRNELITVYAGSFSGKDSDLYGTGISLIIRLLSGSKAKSPEMLLKGKHRFIQKKEEKPAPKKASAGRKKAAVKAAPAQPQRTKTFHYEAETASAPSAPAPVREEAPSANRRMTPFYSVPVTNELFHNGNVEAWKKIIQSYNAKYPGLEVYIFYDGEKINDIHSLFKWGKVKHGSTILFAVAGDEIRDVAKLQRYLRQGASPRFEDFLRFPVNTILNLF